EHCRRVRRSRMHRRGRAPPRAAARRMPRRRCSVRRALRFLRPWSCPRDIGPASRRRAARSRPSPHSLLFRQNTAKRGVPTGGWTRGDTCLGVVGEGGGGNAEGVWRQFELRRKPPPQLDFGPLFAAVVIENQQRLVRIQPAKTSIQTFEQ